MHVAVLRLEIRLGACLTRRQKERRLHAIFRKLRRYFNVSIDQVEREELVDEAILAIAVVSRDRHRARMVLERVEDVFSVHPHVEVLASRVLDM
jgi:uncharacterized protein YlxP (DUF503 family)